MSVILYCPNAVRDGETIDEHRSYCRWLSCPAIARRSGVSMVSRRVDENTAKYQLDDDSKAAVIAEIAEVAADILDGDPGEWIEIAGIQGKRATFQRFAVALVQTPPTVGSWLHRALSEKELEARAAVTYGRHAENVVVIRKAPR